jgi:hypothetical protein
MKDSRDGELWVLDSSTIVATRSAPMSRLTAFLRCRSRKERVLGVYAQPCPRRADIRGAECFHFGNDERTIMRYQISSTVVAAGLFAIVAVGNPVSAAPPDSGRSVTLAQPQQAATSAPAPGADTSQSSSGTPANIPGQMMEPTMGSQGHPGPTGKTPPCPAGQTMSGPPSSCR